jgi:hypothetical protein
LRVVLRDIVSDRVEVTLDPAREFWSAFLTV